MANILVVDDDTHISQVVEFALTAAGHTVRTTYEAEPALKIFKEAKLDLAIVDINLPGKDGLWLCRAVREFSQIPIIFLSARDEELDLVMGLTIGGDDYVTKPFSPRELTARVAAVLRRNLNLPGPSGEVQGAGAGTAPGSGAGDGEGDGSQRIERGKLALDLESVEAFWDGAKVELTQTEFKLLKALCLRPRKIFSREEILAQVFPGVSVSDRTIDSHILHIRKKFAKAGAKEIIQTLHGLGYGLAQGQTQTRPESPK
ncbi:MAG: response regulator transcription factor [Deltaproteobacteria bacterium]|jgi:two-component system OmpR family response regulator|nr:response regulator transcription factor [Deltaproteobacteria bacterium]